jgi:hypothetical protein
MPMPRRHPKLHAIATHVMEGGLGKGRLFVTTLILGGVIYFA